VEYLVHAHTGTETRINDRTFAEHKRFEPYNHTRLRFERYSGTCDIGVVLPDSVSGAVVRSPEGVGRYISNTYTVSMCRGPTVTVTDRPLRCLCHGNGEFGCFEKIVTLTKKIRKKILALRIGRESRETSISLLDNARNPVFGLFLQAENFSRRLLRQWSRSRWPPLPEKEAAGMSRSSVGCSPTY
jgi:hypothetical protein